VEYSIFGWFKASASIVGQINKPQALIMRLTNNKEEIKAIHGSKTLAVQLSAINYELQTYSLS
jgi:hypothetical protein